MTAPPALLFATVFGLLLIPVFYVTVRLLLGDLLHHAAASAGSEPPVGAGDATR